MSSEIHEDIQIFVAILQLFPVQSCAGTNMQPGCVKVSYRTTSTKNCEIFVNINIVTLHWI